MRVSVTVKEVNVKGIGESLVGSNPAGSIVVQSWKWITAKA